MYLERWRLGSNGGGRTDAERHAFHAALAIFGKTRVTPRFEPADSGADAQMSLAERRFLADEAEAVRQRAATAPQRPDAFLDWFAALEKTGQGQHDPLFDWLAAEASRDQMRWFLQQEIAGEAGFDDLVALTQVGFSGSAKLELAANYWDEMGRGQEKGMHGPMLHALAQELRLTACPEKTVWQSLALGNAMLGMALNRDYAFHSVGALGAIELTAPGRARKVADGLRRLGVPGKARHYFDLHAVLDVKHYEGWSRNALGPLVAQYPEAAQALAEGALMRLTAGQRCFDRYRAEFGLPAR